LQWCYEAEIQRVWQSKKWRIGLSLFSQDPKFKKAVELNEDDWKEISTNSECIAIAAGVV